MRRRDREVDREEALRIIDSAPFACVAMNGPEGHPYCVPLNVVRLEDRLYFHCARVGKKVDLMRADGRVFVTFTAQMEPDYHVKGNNFTCYFRSAMVSGIAREVTDPEEKAAALRRLCTRFLPQAMTEERFARAIASDLSVTGVWCISMDEVTGKVKADRP